jgi:cytoskeletal protein CcmA (bactofilin family)
MPPMDQTVQSHIIKQNAALQTESKILHIGEGVVVRGEISVPDTIFVDGLLEGDITTQDLVVGPNGTVRGKITVARNADIYGKVSEKLEVKNFLIVRSTASIEANVSYGMLQIEKGGSLAGGVSSSGYRQSQPSETLEQPVGLPTAQFEADAPAGQVQSRVRRPINPGAPAPQRSEASPPGSGAGTAQPK